MLLERESFNIRKSISVNISPHIASTVRGEVKNCPHLRECFGEFHKLNDAFLPLQQLKAKNTDVATQKKTFREEEILVIRY